MVGAGSSGNLYPNWSTLIDTLKERAREKDSDFDINVDDYLNFADRVKECLGSGLYNSTIKELFKPGNPTHERFHEVLCSFPFRGITTTNYDMVLEYALNSVAHQPDNSIDFGEPKTKARIHDFLLSLNPNSGIPKRIAHLHGKYDLPSSIVLGGKEYMRLYGFKLSDNQEELYERVVSGTLSREQFQEALATTEYNWPFGRRLLWSLLATRRVVFIGFSMNDPYFIKMLDFIRDELEPHNSETHFLVLRVDKDNAERNKSLARSLKMDYGIETVFFEDDDSYKGLSTFIMDLEPEISHTKTKNYQFTSADHVSLPKVDDDKLISQESTFEKLFKLSIKHATNED